jgi:hypothetical protein
MRYFPHKSQLFQKRVVRTKLDMYVLLLSLSLMVDYHQLSGQCCGFVMVYKIYLCLKLAVPKYCPLLK